MNGQAEVVFGKFLQLGRKIVARNEVARKDLKLQNFFALKKAHKIFEG